MNPNNKVIGANGCKLIDDQDEHTDEFFMIIVQENTIFNVLEEGGADATGDGSTNISGSTLKQGAVLTPLPGKSFDKIDLTSGAVIGYRS